MLTAIRQWVIKTMMKGNTGVIQTMPKQQIIEMNVQITAQRMMQNGINPNDMKTVGQVENVIQQIEQPKVNVNPGMTYVKKADVLDMEGNKIPEGSQIMGGKAVPGTSSREKVKKEAVEKYGFSPENFDEIMNSKFDEKIGDDLLRESDAQIKARLDKSNEEGIASMKNKLEDPEEKADGGRIGLLAGSTKIPAVISALLKNKKKVNQAVNDIFPTGDYKYDAQMAADALVENNPKTFKGMLYEDLDMDTQMEVYGAALSGVNKQNALMLQMKKATRPEKTLASMNEGKGINMSDPEIADEFARFMKETDPKGTKELEQKLQLENFKTKDRSENAEGGRIGYKFGIGPLFNFLNKKSPVKAYTDYLKSVKDRVKAGKEAEVAGEVIPVAATGALITNQLKKKLKAMNEEQKKEIEKKANGGRIGLEGGTNEDFQKYLKERERFEKERGLEQLFREYQEDLRRQEVGEQKQMAADGGRIGLKAGMTKRGFLKLMGSVGAGIGAAKSGLFSFGKGATKQAAKEVAQQTTSGMPPPYFFKLAEKIKKMGDDVTAKSATKDREVVTKFKEYEMTEDVATGEIQIMKSSQSDEAIDRFASENANEEIFMRYKPGKGQADETTKGRTIPDEYEANTSYISNNKENTGEILEELDGVPDDILKEVGEAPSIKKASGGLAYMLGE